MKEAHATDSMTDGFAHELRRLDSELQRIKPISTRQKTIDDVRQQITFYVFCGTLDNRIISVAGW